MDSLNRSVHMQKKLHLLHTEVSANKKQMKKTIVYFLIFVGLLNNSAQAQSLEKSVKLALQDVIDFAIEQSPSIKYYQNRNVNYYWRWKNFRANFRPQLGFSGNMPSYNNQNNPV